jgi:putative restriction endonuclease
MADSPQIEQLSYYARLFERLRVDRARGIAPHKPILLLSVIELIAQEKIKQNQIHLTPELISTFLKYWGYLGSANHHSDISLPFFHLTSDKFWHLVPNLGYEAAIATKTRPRNLEALRNTIKYAYIDDSLFDLLNDPLSRTSLSTILVQKWFQEKDDEIQKLLSVDAFQNIQSKLFEKGGAVYRVEELADEEKAIVRDAAFRKIVVSLYDYRCAFCKLRIISQESQTIVDGAHIKPFSEFRDDRFDNGLALCKNHHWAFDHGWFGIDDGYKIIIPHDRFQEEPPIATRPMKAFEGEQLLLPTQAQYNPRQDALAWHRDYWKIA